MDEHNVVSVQSVANVGTSEGLSETSQGDVHDAARSEDNSEIINHSVQASSEGARHSSGSDGHRSRSGRRSRYSGWGNSIGISGGGSGLARSSISSDFSRALNGDLLRASGVVGLEAGDSSGGIGVVQTEAHREWLIGLAVGSVSVGVIYARRSGIADCLA